VWDLPLLRIDVIWKKDTRKNSSFHMQRTLALPRHHVALATTNATRTATTRSRRRQKLTATTMIRGKSSEGDDGAVFDEIPTNTFAQFQFIPDGDTWLSENWRWGSAIGIAHDCAQIVRTKFFVEEARVIYLENFALGDWHEKEEIKLLIALLIQREGHVSGDPHGWTSAVGARLVDAEFEDEKNGFKDFVECVRAHVGLNEDATEREVLVKALEGLKFVERGP
jgi:hypothetical protein